MYAFVLMLCRCAFILTRTSWLSQVYRPTSRTGPSFCVCVSRYDAYSLSACSTPSSTFKYKMHLFMTAALNIDISVSVCPGIEMTLFFFFLHLTWRDIKNASTFSLKRMSQKFYNAAKTQVDVRAPDLIKRL